VSKVIRRDVRWYGHGGERWIAGLRLAIWLIPSPLSFAADPDPVRSANATKDALLSACRHERYSGKIPTTKILLAGTSTDVVVQRESDSCDDHQRL
jgi:hypothetical protein